MRLVISAFAAIVSGCAMGGLVTISEPSLPETKLLAVEQAPGIYRSGGLSLSVKPQNADVSLLTAGILVPIVPLGGGNKLRQGAPFQLVIQFEHTAGTYTLAPAQVTVSTEDSSYSPVSFQGPLTETDSPKELQKVSVGHSWVCSEQGKRTTVRSSAESFFQIKVVSSSTLLRSPFRRSRRLTLISAALKGMVCQFRTLSFNSNPQSG